MGKYIGESVLRKEDNRFITGKGNYTDDISLNGMTYAAIVRSPIAHGKILSINTSRALSSPGVIAIYTGEDVKEFNGPIAGWQVDFINGDSMKEPKHPLLVSDKVRHLGDGVAMILAETEEQAEDAITLVDVEYEELSAVTDPSESLKPGAPLVHDDVQGNKIFDWQLGDKDKTDQAIANAEHVTKLEIRNQRLVPNAIEPRSAVCTYDSGIDEYTLYTTSQNPQLTRLVLCAFSMGIPENKVKVIAPDVGGGFGSKIFHYTEEALILWASKKIDRPVKWTANRSESFLTDAHGRDHNTTVELGIDSDGKMLGLRVTTDANIGAYLSAFSTSVPTYLYGTLLQGLYTFPAVYVKVNAALTHTNAVDAVRGAGRPEATYLIERVVEAGAIEMNMDPVEFRKINLIPKFDGIDQPGYQTQVALQYDSGNYEQIVNHAVKMLGYEEFKDSQLNARKNGKFLGVGFSTFIEACSIAPSAIVGSLGCRVGLYESASVRVDPTGKVNVFSGSHSHGQGHDTTFSQITADKLGIEFEDINVIHGDSSKTPFGMGTYGSRSLAVGGSAILKALEKIILKGNKIAAHLLEAAEEDLDFAEGKWTVKGTDRSKSFGEIALTAYIPHNYPSDLEPGLEENGFYDPVNFTFPFGAYIAVVEVDAETGKINIQRFVAADDVGNIINPMIVDGQVHGGVTHGIGQAVMEEAVYDESGQLLSGSFLDYCMPRADDVPKFELGNEVTPCPHNALGAKGVGEVGAIGAPPAVVNAVINALTPFGIKDMEMPLTPPRVWSAIQSGKAT